MNTSRLAALHEQLCERFDLEELRTLCFDLGVEYDDLRGDGKSAKARELVTLMQRRGRLAELAEALARQRPTLRLPLPPPPPLRDIPDFVDRDAELARIRGALREFRAVGVFGLAGVGKTALATRVACDPELHFPDGISWPYIEKDDTVESLIGKIAVSFGEPAVRAIPDPYQRREAFRNLLGWKEALLVLDDVQLSEQVQEVLDLAPRCAILVTSRKRLALPKLAEVIDLDCLPPDYARKLFASRCRPRELDPSEQVIAGICRRLGDLPKAIDLAAALIRTGRVGGLRDLLGMLQHPIDALEGVDAREGIRLAFEISYSSLSKELQSLFSSLGVFSAESFSEEAIRALHSGREVDRLLGELVAQSLLERVQDYGTSIQLELERYTLHPLLREFALERLVETGQGEKTRTYHAEYFLDLAHNLGNQIQNLGPDAVWVRLDQDLPDLLAAMQWSAERLQTGQLDHGWPRRIIDAASAMGEYWRRRGYPDDWLKWSEKGIQAWEVLDPQEVNIADLVKLWEHKGLALESKSAYQKAAGAFHQLWGVLRQTLELTEEQIRFLNELPDPTPEVDASITQRVRKTFPIADPSYRDLAFTSLHIGINELRTSQKDNAMTWTRRGYWLAAAGDVGLELARAHHLLGILHRARDLDRAIEHGERALAIFREQALVDPSTKAAILNSLGIAYRQRERFEKAIACSREAKSLEIEMGNIINQANCSTGLAEALRAVDQYESAIAECEEALAIYRRVGHTEGEIAALMNMAESYLDQGKVEEALERGRQSKDIFESHAQRPDIFRMGAMVYTILGKIYHEGGQFEEALRAAQRARAIAEQTGSDPDLREALPLMAKALRALGRESEAQDCEAFYENRSQAA